MGVGDFFRKLFEKEELDPYTGLPKHLIDKQEKAFLQTKKLREKEKWREEHTVRIEGFVGLNYISIDIPPEFFEKLEKNTSKMDLLHFQNQEED